MFKESEEKIKEFKSWWRGFLAAIPENKPSDRQWLTLVGAVETIFFPEQFKSDNKKCSHNLCNHDDQRWNPPSAPNETGAIEKKGI
jgi:hypothetical protein